ncbi:MAG TPA: BamA/TamA family outer membrane protein [Steroidobacteraceae bacterium]|nr:BamA/TamA family outer membrane protein [Steroidobacteraceae bacterium]
MALAASLAAPAWGADPQGYKVRLEGTVAHDIATTLNASSDLVSLRKSAPVSPLALILRARGDTTRLKDVLGGYGYYESAVTATIDGEPLTNSDLADRLTALPAGKDATVVVSYTPGPLYHIGKITFDGDVPPATRELLELHTGQPAVAADVIGAGTRLLRALQDKGYAFASVVLQPADLLPDAHELDVTFAVTTGKTARFGSVEVTGLQRTQRSSVMSRLGIHTGDPYSADAIDKARRNLLAMGVFGTVAASIGQAPAPDGSVPVTFRVTERKRHAVNPSGAYSTDLGGSGTITWSDNNLFGHAEKLNLSASIINLGSSATNGVGYSTGAQLVMPEFASSQQTLQFTLNALKQYLLAYTQTAETAGVTLTRNLSRIWSGSVGFTSTEDAIVQPQEQFVPNVGKSNFHYTLFAIPISLRYDSTDLSSPLLDPTHGIRAALTVSPTLSLGPPNATYVISQLRASAYLDLHDLSLTAPGRTVIAVHGLYGYAQGASVTQLPPDQRFYAGGSGSVRGYPFQSIGPQFSDPMYLRPCAPSDAPPCAPGANITAAQAQAMIGSKYSENTPIGGVAVDAGSVELRQRVGRNYGFAVFADAGRVGQTPQPFGGQYEVGMGAGLRYYTPIGPLRLDVAFPLHMLPAPNNAHFEIYIGLGQSF